MRKVYRQAVRAPGIGGAVRQPFRPRHQEIVAVDAIDLAIGQGEAVGYVGPKGAGEPTLVSVVTAQNRSAARHHVPRGLMRGQDASQRTEERVDARAADKATEVESDPPMGAERWAASFGLSAAGAAPDGTARSHESARALPAGPPFLHVPAECRSQSIAT